MKSFSDCLKKHGLDKFERELLTSRRDALLEGKETADGHQAALMAVNAYEAELLDQREAIYKAIGMEPEASKITDEASAREWLHDLLLPYVERGDPWTFIAKGQQGGMRDDVSYETKTNGLVTIKAGGKEYKLQLSKLWEGWREEANSPAKVAAKEAKAAAKEAKAAERKKAAKAARDAARGEGLTNNVTIKKMFQKIGIDIRERSDITGEKGKGANKTGAMVGTFRLGGKPADYWGQKLVDEGWLAVESQEERGNEDMRASADDVHAFMRRIFDGQPVFKIADMAEKVLEIAAEEIVQAAVSTEDVNQLLGDLQDFPQEVVLDAFDLYVEAMAAGITDDAVVEDIAERAAVRADNGEDYAEAARAEIAKRANESSGAQDQQVVEVAPAAKKETEIGDRLVEADRLEAEADAIRAQYVRNGSWSGVGARSAQQQWGDLIKQARELRSEGREFGLTEQTPAELKAADEKIKAAEAQEVWNKENEKKLEREAKIAKEIADRQVQSAENFVLGQLVEDALAGQGDVLAPPIDKTLNEIRELTPEQQEDRARRLETMAVRYEAIGDVKRAQNYRDRIGQPQSVYERLDGLERLVEIDEKLYKNRPDQAAAQAAAIERMYNSPVDEFIFSTRKGLAYRMLPFTSEAEAQRVMKEYQTLPPAKGGKNFGSFRIIRWKDGYAGQIIEPTRDGFAPPSREKLAAVEAAGYTAKSKVAFVPPKKAAPEAAQADQGNLLAPVQRDKLEQDVADYFGEPGLKLARKDAVSRALVSAELFHVAFTGEGKKLTATPATEEIAARLEQIKENYRSGFVDLEELYRIFPEGSKELDLRNGIVPAAIRWTLGENPAFIQGVQGNYAAQDYAATEEFGEMWKRVLADQGNPIVRVEFENTVVFATIGEAVSYKFGMGGDAPEKTAWGKLMAVRALEPGDNIDASRVSYIPLEGNFIRQRQVTRNELKLALGDRGVRLVDNARKAGSLRAYLIGTPKLKFGSNLYSLGLAHGDKEQGTLNDDAAYIIKTLRMTPQEFYKAVHDGAYDKLPGIVQDNAKHRRLEKSGRFFFQSDKIQTASEAEKTEQMQQATKAWKEYLTEKETEIGNQLANYAAIRALPGGMWQRLGELARTDPAAAIAAFSQTFGANMPSPADLFGEGENLAESIQSKPGANIPRIGKLLGHTLYGDPGDMQAVTVKELLQNSFDGVRSLLANGGLNEGKIAISTDNTKRTVTVIDNGLGMSPEILSTKFLEIAGSHKEGDRSSGGFGVAKMQFLYGNKEIEVRTLRDGVLSTLKSTGAELSEALGDPSKAPNIEVERDVQSTVEFPDGHGTSVKLTIPASWNDPTTGETKTIDFWNSSSAFKTLERSPLFENVEVTFNGSVVEGVGKTFKIDEFAPVANVDFGWGTARLYAGRQEEVNYGPNVHVLSNGIWQFSQKLAKNPMDMWSDPLPRTFYLDLDSKARPEDPGYPFAPNRQAFSPITKQGFEQLLQYIGAMYRSIDMASDADNFGSVQYLEKPNIVVTVSDPVALKPEKGFTGNLLTAIKPADDVTLENGRLIINGKEAPTLSPSELRGGISDLSQFKMEQSSVPYDKVLLHDNLMVRSGLYHEPITQAARAQFGYRFDRFVHTIGNAFKELRDEVAKVMDYPDMAKEPVGISFDVQYRGVSIRIPFSASMLNIAAPEELEPRQAALGFLGTMLHELAHYKRRSHDSDMVAEMQRIVLRLEGRNPDFVNRIKRDLISAVEKNHDILTFLNGLQHDPNSKAAGKRLVDSSNESRFGNAAQDLVTPGADGRPGRGVSGPVQGSPGAGTEGARYEAPGGPAAPANIRDPDILDRLTRVEGDRWVQDQKNFGRNSVAYVREHYGEDDLDQSNVIYGDGGYSRYRVAQDGQVSLLPESTRQAKIDKARAASIHVQGDPVQGADEGKLSLGPLSPAPIWRSTLAEAVAAKAPFNKQESIGRGQLALWLAARAKDGTVKPAELEWSGLTDWLTNPATGDLVTKGQVSAFLADNGVRISERVLGEFPFVPGLKLSGLEDGERLVRDDAGNVMGRGIDIPTAILSAIARSERFAQQWQRNGDDAKAERLFQQAEKLNVWLESYSGYGAPTDAKFFAWQFPGGENYRELLLTLPAKVDESAYRRLHDELAAKYGEDTGQWDSSDPKVQQAMAMSGDIGNKLAASEFTLGHYGEVAPNVLAHIRFNERKDANGKRVLFIEEIQSDWAQKGRRSGFDQQGSRENFRAWAADRAFVTRDPDQQSAWVDTHYGKAGDSYYAQYLSETKATRGNIPSAPFVTKTESWVGLALKRIIRYAAENGFDRVAWASGEQQANRYDLSQQVDSIAWVSKIPEAGGAAEKSVQVNQLQKSMRFSVKNGVVSNSNFAELNGKKLEDVLGKEVAKKIVDETRGTLSGEGLKIGGAGMKVFYDKIVPSVANDVLKKLGGGRVAQVDLSGYVEPAGTYSQTRVRYERGEYIAEGFVNNLGWQHVGEYKTRLEAEQAVAKTAMLQPGFDITPKLREMAMQGMPMFSLGRPKFALQSYVRHTVAGDVPQSIDSAATSRRQVPAAMKRIVWERGAMNVDIGAGKFSDATEYLAQRGVTNLEFDPFNRTQEQNFSAIGAIAGNGGADSVTVLNVLNVIKEAKSRDNVIRRAAKAVKQDGAAYFQVYEGNGSGVGERTRDGWQENRTADSYLQEIRERFGDVVRRGQVIEARDPIKIAGDTWQSPDGGIQFSIPRGEVPASAGLPKARIERFVQALRKQWKNAPNILVVDRVADLPRPAPPDTHGMFYQGTVYLVAENLKDNAAVQSTVLHETMGHYGLRGILGNKLDAVMERIYRTNDFVRKEANRRIAGYKEHGRELSRALAAEEVLADMAGEGRWSRISGWQMLFAQIRNALRKLGFTLKMSDAEVAALLANSRRYVREGVQQQVDGEARPALSLGQITSEVFKKWFGESKVVDENGRPLVVYRGEHGETDAQVRSRLGSISFSNRDAANTYAVAPNDRRDSGELPRVIPAYLSIQNPVIENRDDPFIDMNQIAKAIGEERALQIAQEQSDGIEGTSAWMEDLQPQGYTTPADYLRANRGSWDKVYLDAYRIFDSPKYVEWFKAAGYDGAIHVGNGETASEVEYKVFSLGQIKSATGNAGTFDPNNDDVRLSLGRIFTLPQDGPIGAIKQNLLDRFSFEGKSFSWINKTINTQFHKAETNAYFRPIFQGVQRYIADVNSMANDAADLAGENVLPRMRDFSDVTFNPFKFSNWKKEKELQKDLRAVGQVFWAGTLGDIRPTPAQLANGFTTVTKDSYGDTVGPVSAPALTQRQIEHYNAIRKTIDLSLDQAVASEMVKISKDAELERLFDAQSESMKNARKEAKDSPQDAERILTDALQAWLQIVADMRGLQVISGQEANKLDRKVKAMMTAIEDKGNLARKLQDEGYAPLMRFGRYTVKVMVPNELPNGEIRENVLYFGMFESMKDANKMGREMLAELQTEYPDAVMVPGTMDTEAWKQMRGLSLDTLEAFASITGMDEDKAVQEYLKMATASRSALKRLIHRKGIQGYDEDIQRVLATFVTSQARYAARNYHFGELAIATAAIPQEMGEVRTEAALLTGYVQNPAEEAQGIRGFLFTQFLGGSIASALTNITQPILMTLPYLSQYASDRGLSGIVTAPAAATRALAKALQVVAKGVQNDPDLKEALDIAAIEGHTEPQEIHQLYAESIRSGLGGRNLQVRKALRLWGSMFSLSESFNRKITFVAAFEMARNPADLASINAKRSAAGQETFGSAYEFAVKAVDETQGIYNKGNRPNWARGGIGATIFTFKQFSIAYVEFLSRLPAREKAIALAILVMAAGAEGLPFEDDLVDLWDTIWQALGFSSNAKKSIRGWAVKTLGEAGGGFLIGGISGLPGSPVDVSGRLGVGNLIPGTGIFARSTQDATREVAQALGPLGSVVMSARQALSAAQEGQYRSAVYNVVPKAIRDAMQAADMYQTGYYRDLKGRRTIDVTGVDAAFKAVGLMPHDVALDARIRSDIMQDVALHNVVEAAIADRWARGITENDEAEVKAAIKQLFAWNLRNPQSPISINPQQIRQRVQAANMSAEARLRRQTPREMRAQEFAR